MLKCSTCDKPAICKASWGEKPEQQGKFCEPCLKAFWKVDIWRGAIADRFCIEPIEETKNV